MTLNNLTTLSSVKSWAGVTTTNDDTLLTQLIGDVSRFMPALSEAFLQRRERERSGRLQPFADARHRHNSIDGDSCRITQSAALVRARSGPG